MSNQNTLSSTLPVQRSQINDQRNGEKMLKLIEQRSSGRNAPSRQPTIPIISIHASPERVPVKQVISTATYGAQQHGAYFDRNLDELHARGRGRGRGRGQHRGQTRNRGRGRGRGRGRALHNHHDNYNLPDQLLNFGKPGGPIQA